jgi:ribosomal subunit interface protein
MQLTVKGKQMDVGDSLRGQVESRLDGSVSKYFNNAIEATVVFTKTRNGFEADCSVHIGSGMTLQSHGEGSDAHIAFDAALERLDKQLRRYKRRINDHHKSPRGGSTLAQSYILAPEEEDSAESDDGAPLIVAEGTTDLPEVTVGEAVMRMDLADVPVFMFHNSAHGRLNVVYRRADGNYGWIDPSTTSLNSES